MAKHKYLTSPPNMKGMPPGVPYIIGNEAAERFSYYGMKSILTVFMASYILNQSGALAPMHPNEAYMSSHYFVSGVYFLPILGAIIADGWLGKYWTIFSLSIVYCFGHLALAFMDTAWGIAVGQRTMLAAGLFLICLGAGGIKPCVSANVGDQFGESNKHLLSKDVWLVLLFDKCRLVHFHHRMSVSPGRSAIRSTLGIWHSRHFHGDRHDFFLGRSKQDGACAPGWSRIFARNV